MRLLRPRSRSWAVTMPGVDVFPVRLLCYYAKTVMNASNSGIRLSSLLLVALTILFLIVVQAHHFHARPYRQDEAWVVHHALANIKAVGLARSYRRRVSDGLYPENFLQDIWVHFFGHIENIVRFFSTLVTAFTLAITYRLGKDLYDSWTGWLALLLLGTYAIFSYYSHEARPYAALAFGAVAFPLTLLQFIREPALNRALLATLAAVLPSYLHPFMIFVILAQLLCVLVFVRPQRHLNRRLVLLVLAIALLVGFRILINYTARGGSIGYSVGMTWAGMEALYDYFSFNPEALGLLLVLGGLATLPAKLLQGSRSPQADTDSRGALTASPSPFRLADAVSLRLA